MWIKASEALANVSTMLAIQLLAEDLASHEAAVAQVREFAADEYIIEADKDPEAGNHNYLALSGHYGHGNSRTAKSIGHRKRGYNKTRQRVRQNR